MKAEKQLQSLLSDLIEVDLPRQTQIEIDLPRQTQIEVDLPRQTLIEVDLPRQTQIEVDRAKKTLYQSKTNKTSTTTHSILNLRQWERKKSSGNFLFFLNCHQKCLCSCNY